MQAAPKTAITITAIAATFDDGEVGRAREIERIRLLSQPVGGFRLQYVIENNF